nr:MAG TPA: hypothetical protein [Caudoviricetes sp.]
MAACRAAAIRTRTARTAQPLKSWPRTRISAAVRKVPAPPRRTPHNARRVNLMQHRPPILRVKPMILPSLRMKATCRSDYETL